MYLLHVACLYRINLNSEIERVVSQIETHFLAGKSIDLCRETDRFLRLPRGVTFTQSFEHLLWHSLVEFSVKMRLYK